MRILAVDVGTSTLKVAVFDDGVRITGRRAAMPPLEVHGDAVTQPLAALLDTVDTVVDEVARETAPDRVALTTQRDTALAVGGAELVSWRDRRHASAPSIWDALADAGTLPAGPLRARSLASCLVERWTGRAAESDGTLPRHLRGTALDRIRARFPGADVPDVIAVGAAAGPTRAGVVPDGLTLHLTSGDKNAELLGAGVMEPGVAGLSLGSAISLGVAERDRPQDGSGRVITVAAAPGRWNVETGIITGMTVLDHLRGLTGRSDLAPDDSWREDLWYVPLHAGALDEPCARGAIAGLDSGTTADDLARAWAQGVACELARLAPVLTTAHRIAEVRVYGGGANETWARLLADVLGIPVALLDDPWRGARGAAMAVLLHLGETEAVAALQEPRTARFEPDPKRQEAVARYRARYDRLLHAGAA